jgi:hypothetical protein
MQKAAAPLPASSPARVDRSAKYQQATVARCTSRCRGHACVAAVQQHALIAGQAHHAPSAPCPECRAPAARSHRATTVAGCRSQTDHSAATVNPAAAEQPTAGGSPRWRLPTGRAREYALRSTTPATHRARWAAEPNRRFSGGSTAPAPKRPALETAATAAQHPHHGECGVARGAELPHLHRSSTQCPRRAEPWILVVAWPCARAPAAPAQTLPVPSTPVAFQRARENCAPGRLPFSLRGGQHMNMYLQTGAQSPHPRLRAAARP